MHRRILALVAVLALGLTGIATASAGKKHKPKTKADHGVIHAHITSQKGKTLFVTGDFSDNGVLGSGAILYRTKVTADSSGAIKVTANVTIYTTKGSISGPATALQSPAANNTSKVSGGKYKLTKGTGGYKGWKAQGTFSGTQATDGTYTFKFKGKVTK